MQRACRFKRGGRGWINPLANKRANASAADDVRSEQQLRKAAKKQQRAKEHLQAKRQGQKRKAGSKGKQK